MIRRSPYPARYPSPLGRREPRPSELGVGVTVCVAAWSLEGDIVTASDTMLSWGGYYSSDKSALKTSFLCKDWNVLFAGDDVGAVPSLLRRVSDTLRAKIGPLHNTSADAEAMTDVLRSAFQAERLARAEERFLQPHGLDFPTFNQIGIQALGEVAAGGLRTNLEQYRLPCQLIVCGFDGEAGGKYRTGRILSVENPGVVSDHEANGFCAIGSGGFMASATLAMRQQSPRLNGSMTLYNVCEAKFIAETAIGVGRETLVSIMRPDGEHEILKTAQVEEIRRGWERFGQPKRPASTMAKIRQWRLEKGWTAY